ncbi:MAG: hypothetical protein M9915_17240 [Rhizobacter sp.]|nr:hypothetical protein [Rhizobacter sp.]
MNADPPEGSDPTATRPQSRMSELIDGWQATRAQTVLATRFVANKDDYLAPEAKDIGRAVGDKLRELFVSCDPAPALLQQFDHARPEFIAVHDIGTSSSRKLLADVATATGLPVKKLAIRRQGYGTTLATLEFIEFPAGEGGSLRIYSTEADADTVSRHGLARVLLAYSRLGVLMVGDLPAHALAAAFKPLRDDIITGPWPNRDVLLLPLAATGALATQSADLGRGTGITVRSTPAVLRPSDAWNFINGTWSRLRAQIAATGLVVPALGVAASDAAAAAGATPAPAYGPNAVTPTLQPLSLRPMPPLPSASTSHAAAESRRAALDDKLTAQMTHYVEQLHKLNGMLDCCVFEIASGRQIAHAGEMPDPESLASAATTLLGAIVRTGRRLGLATELPDAAITLDARHLLLRPVPRHPELMLHAVLDKQHANLTLARLQIQRMDDLFDEHAN